MLHLLHWPCEKILWVNLDIFITTQDLCKVMGQLENQGKMHMAGYDEIIYSVNCCRSGAQQKSYPTLAPPDWLWTLPSAAALQLLSCWWIWVTALLRKQSRVWIQIKSCCKLGHTLGKGDWLEQPQLKPLHWAAQTSEELKPWSCCAPLDKSTSVLPIFPPSCPVSPFWCGGPYFEPH